MWFANIHTDTREINGHDSFYEISKFLNLLKYCRKNNSMVRRKTKKLSISNPAILIEICRFLVRFFHIDPHKTSVYWETFIVFEFLVVCISCSVLRDKNELWVEKNINYQYFTNNNSSLFVAFYFLTEH